MTKTAETLAYTIVEAGEKIGLSRSSAYEAARRGQIPTVRIGARLFVPKGPFHRLFGDDPVSNAPRSAA